MTSNVYFCLVDLLGMIPTFNLSFLSKVLEKVVANCLDEHIYKHHLSNVQSAYEQFHSTKMALLKTHNDTIDNMDNRQSHSTQFTRSLSCF